MKIRNLSMLIVLAIVVSGLLYSYARAVHTETGFSFNDDKTVNENFYLFSDNANITESVNGDLVVFGGNVTVLSDVSGDVLVLGGSVNIIEKVFAAVIARQSYF